MGVCRAQTGCEWHDVAQVHVRAVSPQQVQQNERESEGDVSQTWPVLRGESHQAGKVETPVWADNRSFHSKTFWLVRAGGARALLTTLTMDLLYSRVLDAASWNSAVINSTFHTCDMSKRLPRKGAICEDRRCDEGCRCCFRQESQPSSQPDLILGRGREQLRCSSTLVWVPVLLVLFWGHVQVFLTTHLHIKAHTCTHTHTHTHAHTHTFTHTHTDTHTNTHTHHKEFSCSASRLWLKHSHQLLTLELIQSAH